MSDVERDLAEEHESLWCGEGDGPSFPTHWATLKIDMRLMTEEQKAHIWEASNHLKDAGLGFDTGFGGGTRDWELDWSLSGAYLAVRPLYCMYGDAHDPRLDLETAEVWAVWHTKDTDHTLSYPYCSVECLEASIAQKLTSDRWALVLRQPLAQTEGSLKEDRNA